jgi:UPF0716 family protein affecting phage T7 exclusion
VRTLSPLTGLLAFALWVAAEIVLFNLVASWTGGGLAFFLLVMKSVLGALVVQRAVRRKLFDLMRRGGVQIDGPEAVIAWIKGLGGFLLIAPGFGAGLLGLALLTPSVQRAIAARSGVKRTSPRDIDLDTGDWREARDTAAPRFPRHKEP